MFTCLRMSLGSDTSGLQVLLIAFAFIISLVAQAKVSGAYRRYSRIENSRNLTGREVAEDILRRNGYDDVTIQRSGAGTLSDNFDPRSKIVNLSDDVYDGNSIAAIAVAAHECGHVMQYQTGYAGIALRNAILPLAIIAGNISWGVIVVGLAIGMSGLFYIGVALLAVIAVFQLITLPIEFDASKRALATLATNNYIVEEELPGAKRMLSAAAFTYVAALLSTLATIIRLLLMSNNSRD